MSRLKNILGEIPFTAEVYWWLRQRGKSATVELNLERLENALPGWTAQAEEARHTAPAGKNVLIFGMIRYWVEHTSLMGLTLAGLGHNVSLAYLPYAHWKHALNPFDLRRQNAYMSAVLGQAAPLLQAVPLLDVARRAPAALPAEIAAHLKDWAYRDTQYSMLKDEVEADSDLYRLRLERDTQAARAALHWMTRHRPDVVITPNGSILEFGVMYQIARFLDIPVVTYEFGEQNRRIWMAQNADVMRQETDDLWQACQDTPLTGAEWARVRALFGARQKAHLWENFARRWQGSPAQGGEAVRAQLGLDGRPLAVIPANVLGDSLTLGRQVFSGMTGWLRQTIQYFIDHPTGDLIVLWFG